jgi:hypothetical protein
MEHCSLKITLGAFVSKKESWEEKVSVALDEYIGKLKENKLGNMDRGVTRSAEASQTGGLCFYGNSFKPVSMEKEEFTSSNGVVIETENSCSSNVFIDCVFNDDSGKGKGDIIKISRVNKLK